MFLKCRSEMRYKEYAKKIDLQTRLCPSIISKGIYSYIKLVPCGIKMYPHV